MTTTQSRFGTWAINFLPFPIINIRSAARATVVALIMLVAAQAQAQISIRELVRETDDDNELSYDTDDYRPRRHTVLLAFVSTVNGGTTGSAIAAPTSANGNGLTWTLVRSFNFNSNNRQISVFRAATGNNSTAGDFEVVFPNGSTDRRSVIISVVELYGVDITGTNGANAIAETAINSGNSTNANVSTGAIEEAGAGMLAFFASDRPNMNNHYENNWTRLFESSVSGESHSAALTYQLNRYDPNTTVSHGSSFNWGAVMIKLVPAETFSNVSCASTSAASNNQSFDLGNSNDQVCRNGNASNLTYNASAAGSIFVAKANTLTFRSINISGGASMIADQNATINLPANAQFNDASHLFVANGGTVVVNGNFTLNGGSYLRVYGNMTINGNLTLNGPSNVFVSTIGRLTVTGTITINSNGNLYTNGGNVSSARLITRGGAGIELAGGSSVEANVYDDNDQDNTLRTGPGTGCFGVGAAGNGRLNSQNNGFRPISADNALRVCVASGTTVGSQFNSSNRGNASVSFNCGGCAIILSSSTVLPITLVDLKGTLQTNGSSLLQWSVANNDEVGFFTVEYSTDGNRFGTAGRVAKGSSPIYSFVHGSNAEGMNYYRLGMTDKNGKTTYSRTVAIAKGKPAGTKILAVRPTVVNTSTLVEMYNNARQDVSYQVADAAGRVVSQQRVNMQQGQGQFSIDMSRLQPGIYYIQLQTADGQRSTQKVVKQ